ncbi:ankyrin repeat-containing domain protein [Coprinopsis sp. MPI-PUGE-AT-0042]|nr:ankyrin repeat-containing domain protein [Coprinopsis sp. MPI-PUGE-AT-0042]
MYGNPKRKGSDPENLNLSTKRGRWEADLAVPPSECSPTASASALISGVQSAQICGGTFTVSGHGSTNNTVVNYNYGPQTLPTGIMDILSSLSLPNFRDIQLDTHAKATEGTCIWFTTGEVFLFWISNGKILWGIGIPGAGKTILASIVIHYLENLEETSGGRVCVAYVYLRYSEPLNVRDILESLVKQIVERHVDLVQVIEGLYRKRQQERTRPSQRDLMVVLAEFIKRGKTLFFVLDAIDEMRAEDRPILLRLLAALDARLFITSRPLETLQRQFPESRVFDIAASPSDIDLHIKDFLRHNPDVVALLEGTNYEEQIVEVIHRKFGGMFLHAKLQLEALRQCISLLDVEETLVGFPTDIKAIYMKTWERILGQGPKHSNLAKLVLLWITHAHGEITIDTLRHAVATSPETHAFEPKRMVPEAIILSVCCGLVSVDEKTKLVRLVHYTIQDAILPQIGEAFPCPHAILAHVCIEHLKTSDFPHYRLGAVTGDVDKNLETRLLYDPLLAYSHWSWVHHIRQCHSDTSVMVAVASLVLSCTNYPCWNSEFDVDFGGPLHVAAFYGLEHLIPPAARLQSSNDRTVVHQRSPLMLAVWNGHIACTNALLLQPGIDVNQSDEFQMNPLMIAAIRGDNECVQALMKAPDIDINAAGWENRTALIFAAHQGHIDTVKLLLGSPNIDINATDEWDNTALKHALYMGHTEVVQLLLGLPFIDVHATDKDGQTALIDAAHEGHT